MWREGEEDIQLEGMLREGSGHQSYLSRLKHPLGEITGAEAADSG